jgi:hypothetical protein
MVFDFFVLFENLLASCCEQTQQLASKLFLNFFFSKIARQQLFFVLPVT